MRGCFLAFLATFCGCFFLYTLPDFIAAQLGRVMPFWFYEGQVRVAAGVPPHPPHPQPTPPGHTTTTTHTHTNIPSHHHTQTFSQRSQFEPPSACELLSCCEGSMGGEGARLQALLGAKSDTMRRARSCRQGAHVLFSRVVCTFPV